MYVRVLNFKDFVGDNYYSIMLHIGLQLTTHIMWLSDRWQWRLFTPEVDHAHDRKSLFPFFRNISTDMLERTLKTSASNLMNTLMWPVQHTAVNFKIPHTMILALAHRWLISHAHTVVWECCKDDRQSQCEMAKFDPQPTLNPWTDRHQIWNTWLRRGYLLPKKNLGSICPGYFAPYIPEIYTQNLQMFTSLFSVLPSPYREGRWTDFRA